MSRRATHLLRPEIIREQSRTSKKNSQEHQRRTVKNIKEEQSRTSGQSVRTSKLSPVETKGENKNLYTNKELKNR